MITSNDNINDNTLKMITYMIKQNMYKCYHFSLSAIVIIFMLSFSLVHTLCYHFPIFTFWAQMALASLVPFQGPKKSRFSGPTPSNVPRNDVAPLKIITYQAIKTTGTLVVLCTRVLLCSVVVCCCVLLCVVVCCCV
jgi:hypothetical protein